MRDAAILERRRKLPSFQRVQIGDPNQLSEPVPKHGVHVQSNPASPNHMLGQGSTADAEDALCHRMGQASINQLAETGTRATDLVSNLRPSLTCRADVSAHQVPSTFLDCVAKNRQLGCAVLAQRGQKRVFSSRARHLELAHVKSFARCSKKLIPGLHRMSEEWRISNSVQVIRTGAQRECTQADRVEEAASDTRLSPASPVTKAEAML